MGSQSQSQRPARDPSAPAAQACSVRPDESQLLPDYSILLLLDLFQLQLQLQLLLQLLHPQPLLQLFKKSRNPHAAGAKS